MLAAADAQCARIVADGEQEADRIVSEARELAARIEADGRERALTARSLAASEVLAQAKAGADRYMRAAAEAASGRTGVAQADVRALIDQAISLVKAGAGE